MTDGYWLNESASKQGEIELLRADVALLKSSLRWFVSAYDKAQPIRTADMHETDCACLRCARDAAEYLTR